MCIKLNNRVLVIMVLVSLCSGTLCAQVASEQAVADVFQKVSEAYSKPGYISFDMVYRYADEQRPMVMVDSLKGRSILKGQNFYTKLDNLETIHNNDFTITLFKEEKIMNLARVDVNKKKQKRVRGMNAMVDLINQLAAKTDTLYGNFNNKPDGLVYHLSKEKVIQVLIIDFPDNQEYKKIELHIDTASGLIQKMVSVISSEQMLGLTSGAAAPSIAGMSRYAIVTVNYLNYSFKETDPELFDTNNYFTLVNGKELKLSEKYKYYKVMTSNPNL